jgi:hypothetical protein
MNMPNVNYGKVFFFGLSYHHYDHLARWNNIQNQIYLGGINNDNIDHGVNAINW